MQLVIGRIGRAHGIRGAVSVDVHTDDPAERFAEGMTLATEPVERGPLTIESIQWHSGRLLIGFEGVHSRADAEALRGTLITVDSGELPPIDDPEEFYDHELTGMAARLGDGTPVGKVSDVLHTPAGDLLVLARPGGGEALVPFVRDIVPTVDRAGRFVVLDPPEGLLDL